MKNDKKWGGNAVPLREGYVAVARGLTSRDAWSLGEIWEGKVMGSVFCAHVKKAYFLLKRRL